MLNVFGTRLGRVVNEKSADSKNANAKIIHQRIHWELAARAKGVVSKKSAAIARSKVVALAVFRSRRGVTRLADY